MYRYITIEKMLPGKADMVLEAARRMIDATRREPGCISFSLLIPEKGENTMILLEDWSDSTCREVHMETPSAQAFEQLCETRLQAPPIRIPAEQVY